MRAYSQQRHGAKPEYISEDDLIAYGLFVKIQHISALNCLLLTRNGFDRSSEVIQMTSESAYNYKFVNPDNNKVTIGWEEIHQLLIKEGAEPHLCKKVG